MASPRRLPAIKHPIPPYLRLAISSLLLYPSTHKQPLPFLTALLAGPGFGRTTRQLPCHLQAPSITFLYPPDSPRSRESGSSDAGLLGKFRQVVIFDALRGL